MLFLTGENENMKSACLMYHEIFNRTPRNAFSVSWASFKEQVELIVGNGYNTLLFGEALAAFRSRNVVLTFDDGLHSNFAAGKYLHEKGLKAIFYVIKDKVGHSPDYMDECQLKELSEMGHAIGVHGKDHGWWIRKDTVRLLQELRDTKEWIEQITGNVVVSCSAPGGMINSQIAKLIHMNIPQLRYVRGSAPLFNGTFENIIIGAIAARHDMTLDLFSAVLQCDWARTLPMRIEYYAKLAAKRLIYRY